MFDDGPRKLTVTTNEGTTAWREVLTPSSIQFVEFGNQVTAIGDNAFLGCGNLNPITLPEGLKSIGSQAFQECSKITTIRFTGDVPPKIGNFGEVSKLEQIYYPAGAHGYTDISSFGGMTFIEIYRLTVERGVDETGGSRVTITADTGPGKTFVRWRGGDESVFADGSREDISTTIIMPASHLKLTVVYAEDKIEHSHSYGDWQHDDTHHWRACSCGDITDKAVHDFGGWVTDKKPTDTDADSRHRDCNICGYRQTESIAPTRPDFEYRTQEDEIEHSHSYGGWQHDDTHHWHACSCGDIADKAVHDFGGWVTDKKPTDNDAGSRHRDCNTCGYRQTEGVAPTEPDFEYRTLTDEASGVKVSGYFTDSGLLEVKEMLLHLQGDCNVCDDIRQRQKNGELIVLFDIALKSGKYKGALDVEIPVGEQYNGQTVIMLHCKDKVLESRTVTVSGGVAKGTFSSLSPYTVAKVPSKTVITGLPESYTLLVGQSVAWTPAPAGGQWSYDKDLLEMTRSGDTYTFKALKEGKTTATYMVDGVPHTVTITVNSDRILQTGDTMNMLPWTLLMLAALLGCGGLLVYRRLGYKKRHG